MTKHTSPTLTTTRSLIALSLLACASFASASIIQDNFNEYTDAADFPPASPASGAPTWTENGTPATPTYKHISSTSAESPFSNVSGGLGILTSDASTSAGASGGIKTTFDAISGDEVFTMKFDYKVIDSGNNDLSLNANFSGAAFFVMWDGTSFNSGSGTTGFGYQTNDGITTLGTVALDTWYHVELTVNLIASGTDTFNIAITPFGGSTSTYSDNPFRANIASANNIYFINNAVNTRTGSWAIDNVNLSIVPEKSTTASIFGLGAILAAYLIRRRAKKS